jgi:hypothetical protein
LQPASRFSIGSERGLQTLAQDTILPHITFVEIVAVLRPLSRVRIYERRLPHLEAKDRPVFVTWRLRGTLPRSRVFPEDISSGKAFAIMDRLLDLEQSGSLYLRDPQIASMTVDAFFHGAEKLQFYELHAYVVMANHVHILITPFVDLAKITRS